MTEDERELLAQELDRDEGRETLPYVDTVGKITIGVGRNLTDRGLSPDEIDYLLQNDIDLVVREMAQAFPWAARMTPARQRVLANMLFNLGLVRLRGFRNTLAAMERGDYRAAAAGMLASKWARQVGARATRLARMMERGV
jgi:lysozyme